MIWDYYGGHRRFGEHLDPLMSAVDKSDSADLSAEEIENPTGWILLGYVMDPRTGLGRYGDYRISNYQLKDRQNIVMACGHSITNRTSRTDVGKLMLEYGGGGHRSVGTCQVPIADAERVLQELVARMNANG